MSRKIRNPLILLEASTGIEPVYTDLQSAASPLRQLAAVLADIPWFGLAQEIARRRSTVAAARLLWHERTKLLNERV